MVQRITCLMLMLVVATAAIAQDEWKRAYELFRKGNYKDARVMLEESIQSQPDWWFPVYLMGECNLKLKEYKKALENFNDTLTLEVDSKEIPKVKYGIARTYMAMGDFAKAAHAYEELEGIVPASRKFDVLYNRGQALLQLAKAADKTDRQKATDYYSKAIVSYDKALKHPTKNKNLIIEAAYQKAFSQYSIGNFQGGINSLEKSVQAFKDVIAENPKEQRAHTMIVSLAFELVEKAPEAQKTNRFMDAVEYINRYLSHWPGDLAMIDKKGKALQGAKKYKEAISVFETLVQKSPNNGEAFYSLGSCQMAAKQYKSAIGSFSKAVAKGQKDNPSIYSYTAYCYQQQKNNCEFNDIPLYEKAVAFLQKGVNTISGPGKAVLQRDLEQKKDTLQVLRGNLETERSNHLAVIENINKLKETIEANKATLIKNQDLYLQQPTAELKKAIDEGKKAIDTDNASLDEQYSQMDTYISTARKCGGQNAYPSYTKMTALKKAK